MEKKAEYRNFSELDIELNKQNFKEYLKSQDIFKDYNFDGSAISTLLDLFAYNTQNLAYYANMVASEKFIMRAQKRKSVVELANNYGYVPVSRKPATDYLSFTITPESSHSGSITIPKDLKFSTNIDGKVYNFLSTQEVIVTPNSGVYSVVDLEVKEGKIFKEKYPVTQYTKFYTILNAGVDTSRLTVTVVTPDGNSVQFIPYTSLVDLLPNSYVYFLQETENEKFELYFGDGKLGYKPPVGSEIFVEYYTSNGSAPNGAGVYTLSEDVTGLEAISEITSKRASGGAELQTTDSVRLASKHRHQSQNRAVSNLDWVSVVNEVIPDSVDVSVWGGENNIPPQYGKVFVSVVLSDLTNISTVQKLSYKNRIKTDYSVKGITPEFVDPLYTNLLMDINCKRKSPSTRTETELTTIIINTLKSTYSNVLSKFNAKLYESLVEEVINNSDSNIIASTCRFKLYINLYEVVTNNTVNKINYPVELKYGSIYSNTFLYNGLVCLLKSINDDIVLSTDSGDILINNLGKIDYTTGVLTILLPNQFYNIVGDKLIKLYAEANSTDIEMVNNYILTLSDSDINISYAV